MLPMALEVLLRENELLITSRTILENTVIVGRLALKFPKYVVT